MAKNLVVRGFDNDTHSQLGRLAQEKGVSINSIVKDAVDKWLNQQQSAAPKKHHLVLYDNDDSMLAALKSIDGLAKDNEWFRSYTGPPSSRLTKHLNNLGWYEGTILPYEPDQQNIVKYCASTMERIGKAANNRHLCCMDFLINDIARSSLKQAIRIEHAYDEDRIPGYMFCTYRTDTLLNTAIVNIIDLFELHDQVFVLRDSDIYKLHITKENVHKFFL
ncbi:MAG TPA: hypothetical protein VD736_07125 [Nitrososphaera sp.]|nr:hypothetical protein [Nitrososphaera sp.]